LEKAGGLDRWSRLFPTTVLTNALMGLKPGKAEGEMHHPATKISAATTKAAVEIVRPEQ